LPRFFISSPKVAGSTLEIEGSDYHHLAHVRRVVPDDILQLVLEGTRHVTARVTVVEKEKIIAEIIEEDNSLPVEGASGREEVTVHLYMSLLKGSNFELALKKSVEAGVSAITPVVTERTIPKIEGKQKSKEDRWRKIIEEAAKQSYRRSLPVLHEALSLDDIPSMQSGETGIIAHLAGGEHLRDVLGQSTGHVFHLLVGPEGGFSEEEVARVVQKGWKSAWFGFSQLRAETAAIVLPALIIYEKG